MNARLDIGYLPNHQQRYATANNYLLVSVLLLTYSFEGCADRRSYRRDRSRYTTAGIGYYYRCFPRVGK